MQSGLGAYIGSPIQELRSPKVHGVAKKKKKINESNRPRSQPCPGVARTRFLAPGPEVLSAVCSLMPWPCSGALSSLGGPGYIVPEKGIWPSSPTSGVLGVVQETGQRSGSGGRGCQPTNS